MGRCPRKISDSKIYHIMVRGVNKQDIFHDDSDYARLLSKLLELKKELGFKVYAYCLMTNHIHLLIKEKEYKDISLIMKRLLITYAQYYNKKYERIGRLVNDRYLSKGVEDEIYVLNLIRYIHQNPVKIGLSINYKWSSYEKYLSNKDELVDKEFFLDFMSIDNFIWYNNIIETRNLDPVDSVKTSDNDIIQDIADKYKFNPKEVIFMNKSERNNALALLRQTYTARQVSRITGISYSIVVKQ